MRWTDWSHIHEARGLHFYTIPLAFLSIIYGLCVRIRNLVLKNRGKRLPGFVLSIGNITTGGTGKTPAVIMIANWAKAQGYRVAVLSRGYGGKTGNGVLVVSDGKDILAEAHISGDEPWLIAGSLRDIPVVVSGSRYLAGIEAKKQFGTEFFILDDGFQHIRLARDMDIVLADTQSPFGNSHMLPWGPLREPVSELSRADTILFTRSKGLVPCYTIPYITGKPVYTSDHIQENIILAETGEELDISYLRGKPVVAFSGIARPESFRKSLKELGADILLFKAFGDHYPFTRADIIGLKNDALALNRAILVTTEKDWARIRNVAPDGKDIALLSVRFAVTPDEEAFFSSIKKRAFSVLGH
ncbi:MAG: tetraacyldisaccharide 4'-kinase [Deltaproteobacteria bacterium]|nr:tetraacyldisaccharide 4'-kinase [Deltaproteobacteria bacterium]